MSEPFVIGHYRHGENSGLMDNSGMTEPAIAPPVADVPVQQQKMLTQEQVNEIVKREKLAVAERTRQEMQAQMAQMAPQAPEQPQGNADSSSVDQMYQEVRSRLQREFQEEQQKQAQAQAEAGANDLAQKYFLSMGKGHELFDDFNEIMADFNPAAFPQTVALATQEFGDMTPQLMYELVKNPQKLADIDGLANKSPAMAKRMLKGLADSIKTNESAKQEHVSAPAPLNRPKSSMSGANTGEMTLKDLKKLPSLRG